MSAPEPKPDQTDNVRLRPANEGDWPELKRWLALPGVVQWWGSANAVEAEIRIVFETPSAVARIIQLDGRPIGYAHAIDSTHWGQDLPNGMPRGTYDVDCLIAEPHHRGRGIGRRAVEMLVDEVFATTLCIACSVTVPVRNETVVRAYEKIGFRWVEVFDDPEVGPSWLMLKHRPS
ncbi:MAG: GNAT family N-acetyltransferase [Pseudomonadota bacterium]